MKNQLKALVVSNRNISVKILNWTLESAYSVEDALAILQRQDYRIIAVDVAIEDSEKQKLESIAKLFNESVSIVHFSTEKELEINIKGAFRIQKMAFLNHNYLDNAFEMELACKLNMN